MKLKTLLFGVMLFSNFTGVRAALIPYTSDGVELVYSSLGDVTWVKDGNLLGTLMTQYVAEGRGYELFNSILAASSGVIHDLPNQLDNPISHSGIYSLSGNDFSAYYPYTYGEVTWFGGMAFVNYLNSINYGGSNQWRLPYNIDSYGSVGPCDFGGTDCGWNVDTSTGELAKLYYDELGAKAYYDEEGGVQNGWGIFGDEGAASTTGGVVGPFVNVKHANYWSSAETYPSYAAWSFRMVDGYQNIDYKGNKNWAWPVTSGKLSAQNPLGDVPEPGTNALLVLGALILLLYKQKPPALISDERP